MLHESPLNEKLDIDINNFRVIPDKGFPEINKWTNKLFGLMINSLDLGMEGPKDYYKAPPVQ